MTRQNADMLVVLVGAGIVLIFGIVLLATVDTSDYRMDKASSNIKETVHDGHEYLICTVGITHKANCSKCKEEHSND